MSSVLVPIASTVAANVVSYFVYKWLDSWFNNDRKH